MFGGKLAHIGLWLCLSAIIASCNSQDCGWSQKKCRNGRCISTYKVCLEDCVSSSVACFDNSACYDVFTEKCDGIQQCNDGQDERFCDFHSTHRPWSFWNDRTRRPTTTSRWRYDNDYDFGSNSSYGSPWVGASVGIIIGIFALVVIIVVAVICCLRHNATKQRTQTATVVMNTRQGAQPGQPAPMISGALPPAHTVYPNHTHYNNPPASAWQHPSAPPTPYTVVSHPPPPQPQPMMGQPQHGFQPTAAPGFNTPNQDNTNTSMAPPAYSTMKDPGSDMPPSYEEIAMHS